MKNLSFERSGFQRPQEKKLFFSIRVSEWNNIRSLCGRVSENDKSRYLGKSHEGSILIMPQRFFSFFVFKFLMIICSPVCFSDCLV